MWDVVCEASEPKTITLQHHLDFDMPPISPKNTFHAQAEHCKGAPICPSTTYQGAKTLYIYMIWMWDEVSMAFEASTMTLQHHLGSTMPPIFQNPPPPAQVEQC